MHSHVELNAETTLSELLSRVEEGENIVITRSGKPVATLSQAKKAFKPLPSRAALRASQPMAKTSSADILRALRDEEH